MKNEEIKGMSNKELVTELAAYMKKNNGENN
jgi:hypothetical protein